MKVLATLLTIIISTATYSPSLQAEETKELGVAYLAGPDVFYPDAIETAEKKKAFCRKHGIKCIFPLDVEIDNFPDKSKNDPAGLAFEIFQNNINIMRCSDVVLANMTPFRGPSMDAGTSFEMGFMMGLGRIVLAYTVSSFDSPLNFKERTHMYVEAIGEELMVIRDDAGIVTETRDHNDNQIEDFGLIDNLMMPGAVQASGSQILTDDSNVINSFEAAVLEAKRILQSRMYSINYLSDYGVQDRAFTHKDWHCQASQYHHNEEE